jgi:hypothetical protein
MPMQSSQDPGKCGAGWPDFVHNDADICLGLSTLLFFLRWPEGTDYTECTECIRGEWAREKQNIQERKGDNSRGASNNKVKNISCGNCYILK